jgi:transposase
MSKRVPKEIKEQALNRIKNDGVSVVVVAQDIGVSNKTVYDWLTKETIKTHCSILEFNRLKKENEGLYQIIGKLTSVLNKEKKGRWSK